MRKKFVSLCILVGIQSTAFGAVDCYELYWGTNGEPNFTEAYKCFEAEKNLSFLALMTFNGEGVSSQPAMAAEIATKACASCAHCIGHLPTLLQLIDERTENGHKTGPKIEFNEIAVSTTDMMLYASSQSAHEKYLAKKNLEQITQGLSESARKKMSHLLQSFDAFAVEEAHWYTRGFRGGTIRNMEASSQNAFLASQFKQQLVKDIQARQYSPRTREDLTRADANLNSTYEHLMKSFDPIKEAQDRKELKAAQRAWIKYRDASVAFQVELLKGKGSTAEIELSKKTELTEVRTSELKINPDCDNPQIDAQNCPPDTLNGRKKSLAPEAGQTAKTPQEIFQQADEIFGNPLQPNCDGSIHLFKQAAELGNVQAMNRYGFCLDRKSANNPSAKIEAINWYKKAADAGDLKGRYNYVMGLTGQSQSDKKQMISEIKTQALIAARQGNNFGHLVLYALNPNEPEAFEHLRSAAQNGLREAQRMLAHQLLKDREPLSKQDPAKVAESKSWALKAARQGMRDDLLLHWLYDCDPNSTRLKPAL